MARWEAWIDHAGQAGRPSLTVNRADKEDARRAFAFVFDVPLDAVKVREAV